jgi:hypothetical protein
MYECCRCCFPHFYQRLCDISKSLYLVALDISGKCIRDQRGSPNSRPTRLNHRRRPGTQVIRKSGDWNEHSGSPFAPYITPYIDNSVYVQPRWQVHCADILKIVEHHSGPLNPGEKNCGVSYLDVDQRQNKSRGNIRTFVRSTFVPPELIQGDELALNYDASKGKCWDSSSWVVSLYRPLFAIAL